MPTPLSPSPNFNVLLHDYDLPVDVVDALALAPFVDGSQPWSRVARVQRVRAGRTLVPAGTTPARSASDRDRDALLVTGDGWTLRVVRWNDGSADVTVTAVTEHLAAKVVSEVTDGAEEPPGPEDAVTTVGFWHRAQCGPVRRGREITVSPWGDIRRNYAGRTAGALDRLMRLTAADVCGRLLLLHGPPGTGKTTALRALAHAWRSWCRLDYVLDPERFLGDPGYLMTVALGEDDDERESRWRIVLLEDCDELIGADAKHAVGQALARLLNLTDGLLGQGLELIVAITTNEPLPRLHPAVVRPGRCLAQIEVGRLTPAEARTWLGRPVSFGAEGATLAELYALNGQLRLVRHEAAPGAAGMYL